MFVLNSMGCYSHASPHTHTSLIRPLLFSSLKTKKGKKSGKKKDGEADPKKQEIIKRLNTGYTKRLEKYAHPPHTAGINACVRFTHTCVSVWEKRFPFQTKHTFFYCHFGTISAGMVCHHRRIANRNHHHHHHHHHHHRAICMYVFCVCARNADIMGRRRCPLSRRC